MDSSKEQLNDSQKSASVIIPQASESESDRTISFKANEHPKQDSDVFCKQMSRIEAKVNRIQTVLQQIQRMIISTKIHDGSGNSDCAQNVFELPLQTVQSLDKFESDLSTPSYRNKIVSIHRFVLIKMAFMKKFVGNFTFSFVIIGIASHLIMNKLKNHLIKK